MNILSQLKDRVAQYFGVYLKLMKINFIDKTASLLSYFVYAIICLFLISSIILFLGLGLTEFFVSLQLSRTAASFLTMGIYVVFFVIMLGARKGIINSLSGMVIKILTEGDEDDEDDDKTDESK